MITTELLARWTAGWRTPALLLPVAAAATVAFPRSASRPPLPPSPAMTEALKEDTLETVQPEPAAVSAGGAFDGAPAMYKREAAEPKPAGSANAAAPRKLVRTGSLTLEVADAAKARALARAAAARLGAELDQEDASGEPDGRSATLTFKAAPVKFDALLEALLPLGRLKARNVSTRNMGAEYVDLRSRLDNLRRVQARLTQLLSFKTTKLGDVLQVERELERVGSDIETIEGRMKYIDALAASSTLTVTLAEPAQQAARAGVLGEARNALVGAFNTFLSTGLALLKLTSWLAAVALWVVPLTLLVWKLRR